jgi:hypothetical protein
MPNPLFKYGKSLLSGATMLFKYGRSWLSGATMLSQTTKLAGCLVAWRKDYHPCECDNCFFCKYRITYGVQHNKPKAPRFRVPLPGQPESPLVPPPPPSQHPSKALPMKKGWCKVHENRLKERYKNKTVEKLRKMKGNDGGKLMGSISKGCPLCNKGKGVKVCQKCWKTYTHDL